MPEIEQRVLSQWAVLSALALGVLLVGAAYVGTVAGAGLVALAALTMTYGWPHLLDLPSPRGVQLVLLLATVVVVGATLLEDGRDLRWVPVGLAITLVVSFLHQLLRRDGRARLVATLGGTALGAGLIASGACFVGAVDQDDGTLLVLAAVLAVVLSTLLDWSLRRGRTRVWALPLGVLVCSGIAASIAAASGGPVLGTALVALCAGVVAHAVRRLLTVVPTAAHSASQVSVGAATLLATGGVPYIGAWLIEWLATH